MCPLAWEIVDFVRALLIQLYCCMDEGNNPQKVQMVAQLVSDEGQEQHLRALPP